MSASLIVFPILLTFSIVALLCGRSIVVAVGQFEAWAIAAVITVAVTLTTLGVVVV